jgi:gas vesicle protein
MSYAGPVQTRGSSRTKAPSPGDRLTTTNAPSRPPALPEHETDWQQVAVFGAGLALGVLVGAGVALLTAPQSGEETRDYLRRGARRTTRMVGRRSQRAWLDLRAELRGAKTSLHDRKIRRAAERAVRRELALEARDVRA